TDFLVGARLEYDQDRGIILEYLHQGEQPKAFAQDLKNQRLLITRLLDPESHRLFLTPLQNYLLSSLYLRNIRDTYNVTANAIFGLSQVEVMFSLRGDMKVGAQASIALTAAYTAGERTSYYSAAVANDFLLSAEMQITF
ncbi:MAG: hypothetical protein OEW08_03490, partial [Gammaproteobacteria bacterium]|nr:hypothetical protein [Gammaproteobacteria bacterium]